MDYRNACSIGHSATGEVRSSFACVSHASKGISYWTLDRLHSRMRQLANTIHWCWRLCCCCALDSIFSFRPLAREAKRVIVCGSSAGLAHLFLSILHNQVRWVMLLRASHLAPFHYPLETMADHDAAIPRDCITCDGPGCSERAPTWRCSRCWVNYYCSQDCQLCHYKESHKSDCKRIESIWQDLEQTFPAIEPIQPECGICLEVHPEKRVLVPGCNHGFCYPCLFQWQIEDLPSTCPACRKPIIQKE